MEFNNIVQNLLHDLNDEDENDDIEVLDIIYYGLPRQIYIRNNFLDVYDEENFRKRFRISKQCCLRLLVLIEHHLEYPYDCNNAVSPINQVLTTLRYFSTGRHLQSVADYSGMHLSMVSRIIVRVSRAIGGLYNMFIKFTNTETEISAEQNKFFEVAAFPRVVGAIDCTHVKIQLPAGDDAEIFRNRKSYFSMNTQMICTDGLRITNVVARWPGSVHDATIFNNSRIEADFERLLYRNSLLLGDGGYPNKSYLFTPLLNSVTLAEQRYNESHIRSRNCIERCFGVLKRRFPVLAYGCRLKINTIITVIVAAAVLHNLALTLNDTEPPPVPEELNINELEQLIIDGQIPDIQYAPNEPVGAGTQMRRQFINTYFANL